MKKLVNATAANKTASNVSDDTMLFHFTCKSNFLKILESLKLKTTCSELMPPPNDGTARMTFRDGKLVFWDPTYNLHPVVWFTTEDNPDARDHGLAGTCEDKTEFRIGLAKTDAFKSWKDFADEYGADPQWRKRIENRGHHWTWFVHEDDVNLNGIRASVDRKIGGQWVSLASHPEVIAPEARIWMPPRR